MLLIELERLGVELSLKVTQASEQEPSVQFFYQQQALDVQSALFQLLHPTLVRYDGIAQAWLLYLDVHSDPLFLLPRAEMEEYGYYWHHDGKLWLVERILIASLPGGVVTLGLSLKHRSAPDKPYTHHHLSLLCETEFVENVKAQLPSSLKAFLHS